MRHFGSTISVELTERLIEKGMPELLETYAEVFDWFIRNGIYVTVVPERISLPGGGYEYRYRPFVDYKFGRWPKKTDWHSAADAAIEKALKLINSQKP